MHPWTRRTAIAVLPSITGCGAAPAPAPAPPRHQATPEAGSSSDRAATDAALDRQAAQIEVDAARRRINESDAQLEILDRRIAGEVSAVADAQTDAQRADAVARLRALQEEQARVRSRRSAARDDLRRANERAGLPGGAIECGDDPLAQGCA